MEIMAITADDHARLESAGGYLKQYGQNVRRWIENGYVAAEDCYVFYAGGTVTGGVCFSDNTPEEREILDFALIDAEMPNGAQALKKAVKTAVKAETKSIGYDLYNDTEQYADILDVFLLAGFHIAQTKKSYIYERPEPPQSIGDLTYRSIAETGEEIFVSAVKEATAGTLDRLMADDAARLGGDRAALEYVGSMKELDFNADWWRLGYCGGELAGLVLPQKLGDTIGAINYIGVLPGFRGHSCGSMLIAEGTRILHENGMREIIADIDTMNYPMAAALERVGYVFRMDESVLRWNNGTVDA